MDITVNLEPLSGYATGGAYRESSAVITVDSTYNLRLQREAVIYETLGLMLDNMFTHEQLEHLAEVVSDSLEQLEDLLNQK